MKENPRIFGLTLIETRDQSRPTGGHFELFPQTLRSSWPDPVLEAEIEGLFSSLRAGISTDEIYPVPACFQYQNIARFALTGDRMGLIKEDSLQRRRPDVLIGGRNFGCGSAREQAAASLKEAGVKLIIASSFNETFRNNCTHLGLLTSIHLSLTEEIIRTGEIPREEILAEFEGIEREILEAGGLFAYNAARLRKEIIPPKIENSPRPMTMTEKIIAQHLSSNERSDERKVYVQPGDQTFVPVDQRFVYEVFTPWIKEMLASSELTQRTINDPQSITLFADHFLLSEREEAKALFFAQEQFAQEENIRVHHAQKEEGGICHLVMLEKYLQPGEIVIGTDSHTSTGGVLGALCLPVGATAMANALITKDVLVKVPEIVRINFVGQLPGGCMAKDVMLSLLSSNLVQSDESLGKVFEYGGAGLKNLPVDELAVLTNMATEANALTAIIESNQTTVDYLIQERGMSKEEIERSLVISDPGAFYSRIVEINLSQIKPMIALPGSPQNSLPLSSLTRRVVIQKAFIGSCAGGKLTDLRAAARILEDKKVQEGVELVVQPASMKIYHQAEKENILEVFRKAGAKVFLPTCGACIGEGPGRVEKGETGISASNRNYPGRMGEGDVYLANPLIVASSAINGYISRPF